MEVSHNINLFSRAIKLQLASLPNQHTPFEEAFKNRNYQFLKSFLKSVCSLLIGLCHGKLKAVMTSKKSDTRSDLARNNGNELFKNVFGDIERMLAVLYTYDMALCYAESSDRKAKIYNNIAVVYFKMNFIQKSLDSTECALKFVGNSDPKLLKKLQDRKLLCEKRVESVRDAAQLSYPSHPTISGLAGVLKLRGKSIYTEKALKCGDLIAITKSFSLLSDPYFKHLYCNQCGDRTSGAKIPCDFCPHAVFCGESCKAQAMDGFHAIECNYLSEIIISIDEDSLKRLALKFAFKAMSIENYDDYEEEKNFTVFDWMEGDEFNDGIILKTILSMKECVLKFKQMLKLVSFFTILMDEMKNNKGLKTFFERFEDGEKKLFDMYCKAYLVISRNCFYTDLNLNIDWLFGHLQPSCKPNVIIVYDSKLGTNNYLVVEDIAANQELTIVYG